MNRNKLIKQNNKLKVKSNLLNVPQGGFTLIELLLVIVIVGVLSTFAISNYLAVRARGRDTQRKSDVSQIKAALELHRSDQGSYPASLPACNSAFTVSGTLYMQKVPCDPTNSSPFIYTYTPAGTPPSSYTLTTCLENTSDPQKDSPTVACGTGVRLTATNP